MSMRIGEVIDALERGKPGVSVVFAFGSVIPTTVHSWRGIYAEAALGYRYDEHNSNPPTVEAVLAELRRAIDGRTYRGWKGGDYSYNRNTPLHIDNQGEWTATALIRIQVEDWQVTLHTAREE